MIKSKKAVSDFCDSTVTADRNPNVMTSKIHGPIGQTRVIKTNCKQS